MEFRGILKKTINFLLLTFLFSPTSFLAETIEEITLKNNNLEEDSDKNKIIDFPYILGPGDKLFIEFENIPEFSKTYNIGPDGKLYIPKLRAIRAKSLTIKQLRIKLENEYAQFIVNPKIYIYPVFYRPVSIYVGGEVSKPGYYTLEATSIIENNPNQLNPQNISSFETELEYSQKRNNNIPESTQIYFPNLFEALKTAGGVTPYSDLSKIKVIRKSIDENLVEVRYQTIVDFMPFIKKGDQLPNIRLFDGDTLVVGKNELVDKDNLLSTSQTNISPDFIKVFVTGRIKDPGEKVLPQGASLNQAIVASGGPKILRGSVEFVRLNRDGSLDRRIFRYSPNSSSGSYKNPLLTSSDIIRFRDSLLSATSEVLSEVFEPVVGIYTIKELVDD